MISVRVVVVVSVSGLDQRLRALRLLSDGGDDGRPGVVVGELVCFGATKRMERLERDGEEEEGEEEEEMREEGRKPGRTSATTLLASRDSSSFEAVRKQTGEEKG